MGKQKKATTPDADDSPGLPITIYWDIDEKRVNDDVVLALSRDRSMFQRAGELVRIGRRRKAGRWTPVIDPMPAASLREKISEVVRFRKPQKDEHVPDWCVSGVRSRGEWEHIPHLAYAVEYPVLRPDGTVLQDPGYDEATQLYYQPSGTFGHVPEFPSTNDVVAARERILDLVCDFPFSQPVHRAAWVAGLLTPFARPAYDGATPFFLVDANVRAAGKTFLCHVAWYLATGRRMPVTTQAADEAEEGKVITAVARGGEAVKLIDNIARPFGNGKFDAALTSTWWEDRLLGVNDNFSGPLFCIWWGTGNNVQFAQRADTARRTLHIRLLSPDQNPERRTGFKHPHLARHVLQHRPQLVADCLTLLRAYQVQRQKEPLVLPPWGSFEEWSDVVRGALVFAGLPDPIEAHEQLAQQADTAGNTLADLIAGWRQLCSEQKVEACSVREALEWIAEDLEYKTSRPGHQLRFTQLLDALSEQCSTHGRSQIPDARQVSFLLRSFQGRVVQGEYLAMDGRSMRGQLWKVAKHS